MPRSSPDLRVASLASRHHGVVTRAAALRCGFTDRQISHRVASGRWCRLAPGVFRIIGSPITVAQVAYAAVMAAGPGAAAGGLTALALLGVGHAPLLPHITVPPSSSARTRNAIVRRSPLSDQDRTRVGPIPSVRPARAVLEAAAVVDGEQVADLLADALCRGLCTTSSVIGAIRRSPSRRGRSGVALVRSALQPWLEGVRPGSPAELRLLRRLQDWGFPTPVLQHEVALPDGARARLDLAWPWCMAALEYDGERSHTPADVRREEELRALGWWIGRADRHDLRPSSTRLRDEVLPRLRPLAA